MDVGDKGSEEVGVGLAPGSMFMRHQRHGRNKEEGWVKWREWVLFGVAEPALP